MSHICLDCNKQFAILQNYKKHKNKKIPCDTNKKQIYMNNRKLCVECNKIFSSYQVLKAHEKNCKNMPKHNLINMEALQNINNDLVIKNTEKDKHIIMMEKQFKDLQKQIDELKQKQNQNPTIIVDNSKNIIQNINNFNICPFGKETYDHLSTDDFKRIINRGFKSVPFFVEQVHFNVNKPENHNIYISNIMNNYMLVYDGFKWNLAEKSTTLDTLLDNKCAILSDKYDELIDKLNEPTKKKFQRFLDEIDDDETKTQIKNDLKMLLYNNKHITEKTKLMVCNQ